MPDPPSRGEQAALVAFLGAAVGAFATAYAARDAWLLLLPAAVSLGWRLRSVPARVRTGLEYTAWGVMGLTVAYAVAWTVYPLIPDRVVTAFPPAAGRVLAALASVFVLGAAVWRPARTAIPATLATLMVAALETRPSRRPAETVVVATVALVAYLLLQDRRLGPKRSRGDGLRVGVSVLGFGMGAATIALALVRLLPWAQPHVEQATAELLNPRSGTTYAGLSSTSQLGDIERIALSPRIVMRVWSPRAQKLRARVFTRFDGRAWHAAKSVPIEMLLDPAALARDPGLMGWIESVPGNAFVAPGAHLRGELVPSRFVQEVFNGGALVAPARTALVRLPAARLRVEPSGVLLPVGAAAEIYGTLNRTDEDDGLDSGPGAGPLDLREALALPPDIDPRLAALADRLAAEHASPADRIRATVELLRTTCHYSLDVGAFRSRQPVAEFVFEKKRGYCEYFASAAALLLRLQGVPARYVTGFNVQETSFRAGHYVVREADAHAWIETHLEGRGWIEEDATPPAEYAAVHSELEGGVLAAAMERLSALWAELNSRVRLGDWAGIGRRILASIAGAGRIVAERPRMAVAVGFLLVAAAAGWAVRWRRSASPARHLRTTSPSVAPELVELMSRLDAEWAHAGCPRPAWRTPLEHLAALPGDAFPAPVIDRARRVVECFYRARFGGVTAAPDEIRALRDEGRDS